MLLSETDYSQLRTGRDVVETDCGLGQVVQVNLDPAAYERGERVVIEFTATTDGRRADLTRWHDVAVYGPEAEDQVYYERFCFDRVHGYWTRASHGWLDPVSRHLTQAG